MNPEQLTPEANVALTDELAKRRIGSSEHLDAAREEERERKAENDRNLGTLGFIPHIGIGRMRFGKGDRLCNAETGLERFKTTVFVVLFWFPLIPRGTYLVEQKRGLLSEITGLEKLPLDWEQILKVWVVASGGIVGFLWLIRLISSDAAWKFFHRILHYWR